MLPPGSRPTALIDFRSPTDGAAALRLAFGEPRERLRADGRDEVLPLLARVDALARAGAWCVGYVRYEAARAFDAAFVTHAPRAEDGPLALFAVYDAPLAPSAADAAWHAVPAIPVDVRWHGEPDRTRFDAAIAQIHDAIAAGEIYQVNLTAPFDGLLHGDPLALFAALRRAQPNAYAAYLDLGEHGDRGEPGERGERGELGERGQRGERGDGAPRETILSVSPELFFDWRGDRLLTRPMKGTAPRGADAADDAAQAQRLRSSAKERAENLMIVDLLRNDVSRIAQPFSVQVPRLFEVEAWPTVWQMSSDIVARTRAGLTLADVFTALFPCGSVTGAPKVQAMRLIEALEPAPRGVYCGAIGVVQPYGAATFNVPIRTLAARVPAAAADGANAGAAVRCGIGSGITADATAPAEWDEWRHKRAFVERAAAPFDLLETLRLEAGEFVDAPAHLARMEAAARHFRFESPAPAARAALDRLASDPAHGRGAWRVRLLAAADGTARAEAFELAATPEPVRVRLAAAAMRVESDDFLRFKTTRRAHYDAFAPTAPGVFDTLLWNERGQITEFTRGNVAVKIGGRWLTPALGCGLLPGIARARLLREGHVEEAILDQGDLVHAEAIAFFNSLRGWLRAGLSRCGPPIAMPESDSTPSP